MLTYSMKQLPFLEGPALEPEQDDAYFEPTQSKQQASLFEHCARALDLSLATGSHGLSLMGSGDWNDGMNRVGNQGKGESVWLTWFLIATLSEFATVAETRGDNEHAIRWREHVTQLKAAVEAEGWDGAWYRRAYFDDGTPLGSAANAECRIDSIAQSWGVISGAADTERAQRAMNSVREYLIRYGRPGIAVHPAFRQDRAGSRLYQELSPRCAGERRPVYPCGDLVRYRLMPCSVKAIKRRNCCGC